MTDTTQPRVARPDLVEVIGDAILDFYGGYGQHPGVTRAYGAAEAVVAALGRRRPDLLAAAEELADMRHLFEMQWKRMGEATDRWRAEDPEARALVMPDLGDLLRWLMDAADRARAEAAGLLAGGAPGQEWTWRHNRYVGVEQAVRDGVIEDREAAERSAEVCRRANPGDDVGVVTRFVTPWVEEIEG